MANRLEDYPTVPAGALWPPRKAGDQTVQDKFSSYLDQATNWIKGSPEVALATAVVAGVVLGWLIKRR